MRKATCTLCVADDQWFVPAFTAVHLIPLYQHQNGVDVDIVFKNERATMADLDLHHTMASARDLEIIVVRRPIRNATLSPA